METTKKIDKQIEASLKNIEKYKKNIERYDKISKNKYEILKKFYPNIVKYNFDKMHQFYDIFGNGNFDIVYPYFNAKEEIEENKKRLEKEEKRLNSLQKEKENKEKINNDFISTTQIFVDKFEELLVDYKKSYFDYCQNSFKLYFEKIKKEYPYAKEIIKKANETLPYFFHSSRNYTYRYIFDNYLYYNNGQMYYVYNRQTIPFSEDEEELIKKWQKATNILKSDCLKFENVDEYIKYKMEFIKNDWDEKLRKFADKCLKFGIDINKIEFIMNNTSVKECSFQIKDDDSRIIYGRCIWAAEDSDKVTPHIRFIVTEKRQR